MDLKSSPTSWKRVRRTSLLTLVVILAVGGIGVYEANQSHVRGNDRAAQVMLRESVAAALTCWTDAYTYAGCLMSMQQLDFAGVVAGDAPSTYPNTVSVAVTSTTYAAAAFSRSGTCFYIKDTEPMAGPTEPHLTYGSSDSLPCTGNQASTSATAASW